MIRTGTTSTTTNINTNLFGVSQLLTNYNGAITDKKQSNVYDDTDMKTGITTKVLTGNGINLIKIRGQV